MKKSLGSCLCGEVHYEITGSLGVFQYCHCSRCRKFTGSAFGANIIVTPNQFKWAKGEIFLGRFEIKEAQHFATSFCTRCGSSLPWLAKTGKAIIIPAGTLDDDPELRPFQNIFCASKAEWYEDPSKLIQFSKTPTIKC